MSSPRVSAVIPYYNNARTLRRCLLSFANEQSVPLHEIIVVDDGSASGAAAVMAGLQLNVPTKLIETEHRGQSGATNVGIAAATGDVTLLTCADIVAVPGFVAAHARAHATAQAKDEPLGVIGHIAYPAWLKRTPFLRYLSEDGPQFGFGHIKDFEQVGGHMAYSPNVSFTAGALRAAGGFDEGFPYGFQDTDLGLRLGAAGMRFCYRPEALAQHDHPNDLPNFMRRNRSIGRYMLRMSRRYPQLFAPRDLCRGIVMVGRHPEVGSNLQALCARHEAAAKRQGELTSKHRQALFSLYAQATGVAFLEGILLGDRAAAALFELPQDEWDGYAEALRAYERRAAPAAPAARVA